MTTITNMQRGETTVADSQRSSTRSWPLTARRSVGLAGVVVWNSALAAWVFSIPAASRMSARGLVACFASTVIVAGAAAWWSARTNRRLLLFLCVLGVATTLNRADTVAARAVFDSLGDPVTEEWWTPLSNLAPLLGLAWMFWLTAQVVNKGRITPPNRWALKQQRGLFNG